MPLFFYSSTLHLTFSGKFFLINNLSEIEDSHVERTRVH
ncbi:hypothetical protein RintRC_3793 [Richelia intracellularis]|nr:hypothetical protein RintRC_3793 [Richelia intracellularis]